jgi:transposase
MLTNDAFAQLLNLPKPWSIERMEISTSPEEAHVWVVHERGHVACPICQMACPVHDHTDERIWRHLDLWKARTFIHARLPRVRCPQHGVVQISAPWAAPFLNMTMDLECAVITQVLACKTVSGACGVLRMGWDQVRGVMERAVERGLARRSDDDVIYIGVDEKALLKRHKYVTLVYDLQRKLVLDVMPERTEESLLSFYRSWKTTRLANIRMVTMDMWGPYQSATMKMVPAAWLKIVHDRFHVAMHMGKAVDRVRIDEHRALMEMNDDTLKSTKHWWLYGQENLPRHLLANLAHLVASDLKTAKAWTIKEHLRHLWSMTSVDTARDYAIAWARAAKDTGLKPVIAVADLVLNHLEQIINFARNPVTNAGAEGINSIIMTLQRAARGYRTWRTFRIAILFYCGGLALYPTRRLAACL